MSVKYTTYYSNVERIVYELSGNVLKEAVVQYLIDEGHMKNDKRGKLEFNYILDEHENLIVEITKVFEQRTGATKESDV